MHGHYCDPDYFEQLSLFDDEQPAKKVMRIGGVKAKLLDIQQFLAPRVDDLFSTVITVQTAIPLPVDTVSLTVLGSHVEVINDAEFFISSMKYTPFVQYEYVLISLYLLPRIIGGTNEQKAKR